MSKERSYRASGVVSEARRLVGVKYIHQGRSPEQGLDCAGLVFASHLAAGWVPRDPETTLRTDYRKNAEKGAVVEVLRNEGEELASEDYENEKGEHWLEVLHPGVILAMADNTGGRTVRHVAIVESIRKIDVTLFGQSERSYLHLPYIIHADNTRGRVVCESLGDGWMEKVYGAFRFHGMIDDSGE